MHTMIRLLAGGAVTAGLAGGLTAPAHADTAPELTFSLGWGTGGLAHYTMFSPGGALVDGGVLYLTPDLAPLIVTVVLNTDPLSGKCATGKVRLRTADGSEEDRDVTACALAAVDIRVAEAAATVYRGVCVSAGQQWRCLGKPPA